jgi:hypothetical protein
MNREIKIQSVSDIITNSSTEVFMVYDNSAFKNIKELVNAILALAGSDQTFDDLFEIKACVSEYFLDEYPEYAGLTENEILEKARMIDNDNYDGYPYVNHYKVVAKDVKNDNTAKILSQIDEIFDTYARYC